jgi:ApeA N-terminal domain 1
MTIMEKQKSYLGYWWIPKNDSSPTSEDMIAGSISIDANNRVELEILGNFVQDTDPMSLLFNNLSLSDNNNTTFSVIHGKIKGNNKNCLTLLNCKQTACNFGNLTSTKYTIDFVLLHPTKFSMSDELVFRKISFSYNLLFDWIGRTAIEYDNNSNIQKCIPPSIDANINGAIISMYNDVIDSHSHKNFSYEQTAWMEIENPQPLSINEWFNLFITPIRHFLTVATDAENKLTKLFVYPLNYEENDVNSKTSYQLIVYGLSFDEAQKSSVLFSFDMIFGYRDIFDCGYSFESILNKWFALFDRINNNNDNLVYLYTANKYIKGYQEPIFLNRIQALELYYDNILSKKLPVAGNCISEEDLTDIENILSNALERLSDDAKKWIEDKIDYARSKPNQSTAVEKWKRMFDSAIVVSRDFSGDVDKLCKKIKDTRNYYTHYGEKLREKAAEGENLYWLSQSSSYLLLYFLLIEIGFKSEAIDKFLTRNSAYQFAKDRVKQLTE